VYSRQKSRNAGSTARDRQIEATQEAPMGANVRDVGTAFKHEQRVGDTPRLPGRRHAASSA
jgi:hypothetical protein